MKKLRQYLAIAFIAGYLILTPYNELLSLLYVTNCFGVAAFFTLRAIVRGWHK